MQLIRAAVSLSGKFGSKHMLHLSGEITLG